MPVFLSTLAAKDMEGNICENTLKKCKNIMCKGNILLVHDKTKEATDY
jgi:hypothetical protein